MRTVEKVAADLRAIADCADGLEARAIDQGDNPEIPGGEAMYALGVVADVSQWTATLDAAEEFGPVDIEHELDEKFWPPLQTLRFWSEALRTELGMTVDDPRWRPTLTSEANFLAMPEVLEHVWQTEPRYDDFARDIQDARARIENIIRAGVRSDRVRVVCDRCDADKRLIWKPGKRFVESWECRDCTATATEVRACEKCEHRYPASIQRVCDRKVRGEACRGRIESTASLPHVLVWVGAHEARAVWASRTEDDRWKCPGCKHWHTDAEVTAAAARQMRSQGALRWVKVADAVSLMVQQGWRESTVRGWLDPTVDHCEECDAEHPAREFAACPSTRWENGERFECGGILRPAIRDAEAVVESRCDLGTRERWVWWPDVWRNHMTEQQRRAERARARAELRVRRERCRDQHGDDCWDRGCSQLRVSA